MNSSTVIMAICADSSRIGGAVYDESVVYVLADKKDINDPYKGLDLIIQRIQPEIVIISSVQKKVLDYLDKRFKFDYIDISRKKGKANLNTNETQSESSISEEGITRFEGVTNVGINFRLLVVPNVWFSMSQGFQKLVDSEMVKSKRFATSEEKTLFVTSKVEKSTDVCALRSIAAINSYIIHIHTSTSENQIIKSQTHNKQQTISDASQQNQPNQLMEITDDSSLMTIVDIKYLDPGPVLSIDKFSLEALGIFHSVKRKTGAGVFSEDDDVDRLPSLYEILNLCSSNQGKRQLHTMMMWPLQDINELSHRHDTVDYFMDANNILLRDQMGLHLKNIVPLSQLIVKLNQTIGTYREFAMVYKAMWSFVAIMDIIKTTAHSLTIFNRISELDSESLRSVVDSIMNIVDFESSQREKRIQVCVGVDPDVDDKKEIIKNLAKFCDEVAIEETAKYRDKLAKLCKVLYVPRIGFLNSIEYSSTSELMVIKTSKEFDVLLYTERSVYFKTERMEQLDANAGDIACDLIDVQESVIVKLQENLLKHSETILKLMELCGELDCLIAFSIVSLQRGYTRPEFTSSDEELYIKQAYHPLHSTKYKIIPNDIKFYNERSQRKVKTMILTGPNSCGKTTYMKTTCLVVYMAHIGCFVPAEHARIPIIDGIFTRMHSANSISTGLSSFATDLHQVNYAIRKATSRSLIAIDEFGKGTSATDGFHLLKGLMIFFAMMGQDCSYVMVSTHFNRLIDYLQNYNEYILYKTFKVTKDLNKDSIVYEFRSIDGVGDTSLADKVASMAKVPQFIIDRAKQIRNCIIANRLITPMAPHGA